MGVVDDGHGVSVYSSENKVHASISGKDNVDLARVATGDDDSERIRDNLAPVRRFMQQQLAGWRTKRLK